jgi:alpha-1,6-mannosyltransferase
LLSWGSAAGGGAARELGAVLAAACLGALAVGWVALDVRFGQVHVGWALALGLLLRLIAVQASPLLEDDHHRYLWDGLRTATALDPYRLPPSAFFGEPGLAAIWQDTLSGINNPDVPTIYGPALQWLFALAHQIAPGRVGALQGLLLVADMAVLGVLAWQGAGSRALLVYALHPLVLKEAMASAHPDGLLALWLLLALVAWQRQRALWLGVLLGLAVCTKVAALVVLLLLMLAPDAGLSGARRPWVWPAWVLLGLVATVAALYAPFVWAGGSDAAALVVFGSAWRFNPLLYRGIELLLPPLLVRPVAALAIVLGIAALAWRWQRQPRTEGVQAVPPLDSVLWVLLLLSPVVNPWYWLWGLALSVHRARLGLAAACAVSALAYCNSTVLAEAGAGALVATALPYAVAWPLAGVQAIALLAAGWLSLSAATPPATRAGWLTRTRRC